MVDRLQFPIPASARPWRCKPAEHGSDSTPGPQPGLCAGGSLPACRSDPLCLRCKRPLQGPV